MSYHRENKTLRSPLIPAMVYHNRRFKGFEENNVHTSVYSEQEAVSRKQ